jgi:hypothetical protein
MDKEKLPNGVKVRVDTKEYFRIGREERHDTGGSASDHAVSGSEVGVVGHLR